jgi:hypothetical protein
MATKTEKSGEGEMEKIKNAKKRKKEINKEFPNDWMYSHDSSMLAASKPRKTAPKQGTEGTGEVKRKRTRSKPDNQPPEGPDEEFFSNLYGSKYKKENKSSVMPKETIDMEEVENDEDVLKKIDTEEIAKVDKQLLDDFNKKSLSPEKCEDEALVFDMHKWIMCYGNDINRKTEDIQSDIINNISEQIDEGTSQLDKVISDEKQEIKKFKKPVSKSSKQQTTIPEKDKELTEDEKAYQIAKQFFFRNDVDESAFKMQMNNYDMFTSLLGSEVVKMKFFEQMRKMIIDHGKVKPPDLPKLTTKYIEKYLIEPISIDFGHRRCSKGLQCMGMILAATWPQTLDSYNPKTAFILREFLLPEEEERWLNHGIFPQVPKECVLCNIFYTTFRYYRHVSDGTRASGILQDFTVVVDDKDGYNIEYCLEPSVNNTTKSNTNTKNNKRENGFYGIVGAFPRFVSYNYTFVTKNIVFYNRKGDSEEVRQTKCLEELPKMHYQSNGNF